MRYLKKFDLFMEEAQPATQPQPSTHPDRDPGVAPTTTPSTPEKPSRPSPIRRDKPSVEPGPKGQKKDKQNLTAGKVKKITEQDVANRFIALMKQKGEDYKKYVK